jgi:hypothetical protein
MPTIVVPSRRAFQLRASRRPLVVSLLVSSCLTAVALAGCGGGSSTGSTHSTVSGGASTGTSHSADAGTDIGPSATAKAMGAAFAVCIQPRLETASESIAAGSLGAILDAPNQGEIPPIAPKVSAKAILTPARAAYVGYRPRALQPPPRKIGFDVLFYAQPATAASTEAPARAEARRRSAARRVIRVGGVLLILGADPGASDAVLLSCARKADAARA